MKDACLSVGPVCLSSLVRGSGEQSPPLVCQKLLGIWHLGPHFVLIAALQAGTVLSEASEAHRDLGFGPQSHNWEEGEPGEDVRGGDGCHSVSAEGLPGWACQGPQSWHSQGPCHQHSPPRPQHPRQLPGDREAMLPVAEQRFCPDHKWATSAPVRWGPRSSPALATHLGQWVQGNNQGFWSQTDLGCVYFSGVNLCKSLYFFESQKVRILPQKEALNTRVESAWHIVGAQ